MLITDERIEKTLAEIRLLEGEHLDEALLLCEETLQKISEENSPMLFLQMSYTRLRYLSLLGRLDGLSEMLDKVILECEEQSDFNTLARAYNLQGSLFSDYGLIDRALEAYMNGLKIAERIDFFHLIGNVANNIGNLYFELGELEKAQSYFYRALNSIDPSEDNAQSDGLRGILLLNLSEIQSKSANFKEARVYLNRAITLFEKHRLRQSLAHAYASEAVIFEGENDSENAYKSFKLAREIYLEFDDKKDVVLAVIPYVRSILNKHPQGLSHEVYSMVLTLLDECEEMAKGLENEKTLCDLHQLMAEVFHSAGDLARAVKHYRTFEEYRKALDEKSRQQQLNVLHVRFEIEKSIEEKEIVQRKNLELREKSEELLRKKEALEHAYQRIQLISEIGQKITSTLDLNEILISVYDNLKTQMPIDSFYMAVLNDARTHLISVASVENLMYEKAFEVPIDSAKSILAISYRERRTLFVPDIYEDVNLREWDFLRSSDLAIRAIIVVPLLYDEEVVGVCSVQSTIAKGYDYSHLDILNALSTYLAIAINNAQKSKRLEQEIQMRLRTQKELERLNTELRSISEIDGLTKVPNRRRFENVYDQMFEIALNQQCPLHVLMMDIDYFKVYNDHYGHLKGDEVLIAVAQKLNQAFRFKGRLFARYGGEEFVAVLTEMEREEAMVLGQELRIAVSNLGIFHELSPTGFLTISIGLASMVPQHDNDLRRLLHAADECLYRSKNNGRNRVEAMEVLPEDN